MDKEQAAKDLFAGGYNCAQAVLGVFCAENGLDSENALKLASGFGGGMRCGETCGAVSGALMVLGLRCGFAAQGDMDQKAVCNKASYDFIKRFKAENGAMRCRELLRSDIQCPEDHTKPGIPERHKTICPKLIASAVRILEEMAREAE